MNTESAQPYEPAPGVNLIKATISSESFESQNLFDALIECGQGLSSEDIDEIFSAARRHERVPEVTKAILAVLDPTEGRKIATKEEEDLHLLAREIFQGDDGFYLLLTSAGDILNTSERLPLATAFRRLKI